MGVEVVGEWAGKCHAIALIKVQSKPLAMGECQQRNCQTEMPEMVTHCGVCYLSSWTTKLKVQVQTKISQALSFCVFPLVSLVIYFLQLLAFKYHCARQQLETVDTQRTYFACFSCTMCDHFAISFRAKRWPPLFVFCCCCCCCACASK